MHLLADVFENFRSAALSTYDLDPAHYFTLAGFSWDALLKTTDIELQLFTDIDKHLFIERGKSCVCVCVCVVCVCVCVVSCVCVCDYIVVADWLKILVVDWLFTNRFRWCILATLYEQIRLVHSRHFLRTNYVGAF